MCDQSSHTLEQWVYALTTVINIFKFLLSKDRVILQQHFDFIPVDTVGQAQIIFTTNKDSRVKKKTKQNKNTTAQGLSNRQQNILFVTKFGFSNLSRRKPLPQTNQ